jgi:hypothetical protein
MIQETRQQKVRIPPWSAMALVATVASCSSAPGTTGEGSSGQDTNTGTPGASMASGTKDAPGSSGSPNANGTGAGTAAGADNNTFISIPADDLAPPDPADGIQFVTPPGAFTVQPNQEIFPNYCVMVTKDIQVGGFRSWMSASSSHHFILYMQTGTSSITPTGSSCNMGFGGAGIGKWVYATSTPGAITGMNMPSQVGLDMPANTVLDVNMHFINPGTTATHPQIKINILYAKDVKYKAATMISFNTGINVPAAGPNGPGTQTVSGTCNAPVGANFFTMSTHTHKHATAAWINYIHNGVSTEVVHTGAASSYPADQEKGSGLDWEHPGVGSWAAAPFLTVQPGDSFTYSCSYSNTAATPVTVGETAASNEMCMAVSYWFPASLGTASCN